MLRPQRLVSRIKLNKAAPSFLKRRFSGQRDSPSEMHLDYVDSWISPIYMVKSMNPCNPLTDNPKMNRLVTSG